MISTFYRVSPKTKWHCAKVRAHDVAWLTQQPFARPVIDGRDQPRLVQILLAFQLAQSLVRDAAVVPQAQRSLAFHIEKLAGKIQISEIVLGVGLVFLPEIAAETYQTVLVVLLQIVVDLGEVGRIGSTDLFQPLLGRLEHQPARVPLFAGRSRGASQTQYADERRQRQPLHHERHQNHAERQKYDEVPMRKWSAIVHNLR